MLIIQIRRIQFIEVCIEIDQYFFLTECFAPIRHILEIKALALLQILKRLAILEQQLQIQFIFSHLHIDRIGSCNSSIIKPFRKVIDHHIEQRPCAIVLIAHIEAQTIDVRIKFANRNIQLRRFIAKTMQQRPLLFLRYRNYVIREPKRTKTNQDDENHQRTHDSKQRYASRFHCQQLQLFAHIAKRHQRRQQYRQRQCQWHQRQPRIEQKLQQHSNRQTLTYHLPYIQPQELHYQNKRTDKERCKKQQQKILQYI